MNTTQNLQNLRPGDTIRYGLNGTTTVVAADDTTVTVANPDAGAVHGNRNRSAATLTYKRTSARLAALTGLPLR